MVTRPSFLVLPLLLLPLAGCPSGPVDDDTPPSDAGDVVVVCTEGVDFDDDNDPSTACTPVTTCGDGEFEAAPPTASSAPIASPRVAAVMAAL